MTVNTAAMNDISISVETTKEQETKTVKATEHLHSLLKEVEEQSPRTAAWWRKNDIAIIKVLEDFASDDDDTQLSTLSQEDVMVLFERLNSSMAQQEKNSTDFWMNREENVGELENEVSVVFGGKMPDGSARSISEKLVSLLIDSCPAVYTVSRSSLSYDLPVNAMHFQKTNLFHEILGQYEFYSVIQTAKENCRSKFSNKTSVFYLTLGQHQGEHAFVNNLIVAENFAQGLRKAFEKDERSQQNSHQHRSWRVVLTSTDATLPSNRTDTQTEKFTVPTYKIHKYNFVYAMSKLGQICIVAATIAGLIDRPDIVERIDPILQRIKEHVVKDDGRDIDEQKPWNPISPEELDHFSMGLKGLIKPLQDYFFVVEGISICFTPLHAKPWTKNAFSKDSNLSPKAYILEQIVKRLKNAISIDQAAMLHFNK